MGSTDGATALGRVRQLVVGYGRRAGQIAQRPMGGWVGRHKGGGMHVEFFEVRAKMLR